MDRELTILGYLFLRQNFPKLGYFTEFLNKVIILLAASTKIGTGIN
ncbi:MAG: hypothetical protein J7J36_03915 [Thermoplasmata archaeon]|nr:hypothetical protein [Thermoplasmata archaeon]